LLLDKPIDREGLYAEKVYIPKLWVDTLSRKGFEDFKLECEFSREILPLPIDHRYNIRDLQRVSNLMKRAINGS